VDKGKGGKKVGGENKVEGGKKVEDDENEECRKMIREVLWT